MIWVKTIRLTAAGCDVAWLDCHLIEKKDYKTLKEEYSERVDDEYYWSDKHRGIEFEIVDQPPKEWLKKKIENLRSRKRSITAEIKSLSEYLE